jgi:hypothetical protein
MVLKICFADRVGDPRPFAYLTISTTSVQLKKCESTFDKSTGPYICIFPSSLGVSTRRLVYSTYELELSSTTYNGSADPADAPRPQHHVRLDMARRPPPHRPRQTIFSSPSTRRAEHPGRDRAEEGRGTTEEDTQRDGRGGGERGAGYAGGHAWKLCFEEGVLRRFHPSALSASYVHFTAWAPVDNIKSLCSSWPWPIRASVLDWLPY